MIIELNKIPVEGIEIDTDISLREELYEKANVLEIKDIHIVGNINYDYENNLCINLEVKGCFILEDAMTLEPISYPFSCIVEEKIEELEKQCGTFYAKSKNTLDISEILWENIVLEIPIRISHAEKKDYAIQGEGWELVNENKKKIDPRLAKLMELFEDGKE